MVRWGRSVLGRQQVPRKVPPRFRQGSTKVPRRFHQGSTKVLQVSWCLWGRSILGCPKGSAEGATKVPPKFHQGFTKVPPRFFKFCGVSDFPGQILFGLPKGSALSCLTHTLPVRRKRPIMSLLCGYSLGLFFEFYDVVIIVIFAGIPVRS